MNKSFPLLSITSNILKVGGYLLLLVSLFLIVYEGIIEPNLPGHKFVEEDIYQILLGFLCFLIALGTIALCEGVRVLFVIERNTRQQN